MIVYMFYNVNDAVRTQLSVNSAKVQRSFVRVRPSIYRTRACLFMKDFTSLDLKYK